MTFNLNITDFFSRKKTIKNIKADDLRKERITLENEERKIEKDLSKMGVNNQRLRGEYAAATQAKDEHQRRVLGRRLQDVLKQMNNLDQRHGFLLKQMNMVSGLAQIKDNEAFFVRIGAGSAINTMDLDELQQYVEQATLDGELNNERLAELVDGLDAASNMMAGGDESLDSFMAELDGDMESDPTMMADATSDAAIALAIDALDQKLAEPAGIAAASKV